MSTSQRPPAFPPSPGAAEEMDRLQKIVEDNLGDSPLRVIGVRAGHLGEWQLVFRSKAAEENEADLTDDDWAKPYVDEGLAALERGETITLEEHKTRNAARLAAIKRR